MFYLHFLKKKITQKLLNSEFYNKKFVNKKYLIILKLKKNLF